MGGFPKLMIRVFCLGGGWAGGGGGVPIVRTIIFDWSVFGSDYHV